MTPSGASVGPISSYLHKSIFNQRDVYTTPPEGFEIPDSAAAQYVHVLFGLRYENLSCMEAIFVSLVYFAFQTMQQDWKDLVTDIRKGTIKSSLKIPDDMRIELLKRLRPMPDRADKLELEFSKGEIQRVPH
jgi:GH3 auxin-responsive promoter